MNIKPTTSPQKVFYEDINIIRLMLIVLLVIVHAFAPYAFSWPLPEEIQTNEVYAFIAEISFSFMLPMFVFISGFLYQCSESKYRGKKGLKKMLINKFKRLVIPAILFGILYLFLYEDIYSISIWIYLYILLNGEAHLWFLAMLFKCFCMAWCFRYIQVKIWKKILLTFILAIFSLGLIPFGFSACCYYFFYFYLGMISYLYYKRIVIYFQMKYVISFFIIYLLCFFYINEIISLPNKIIIIEQVISNFNKIVIAVSGLIWCYLLINVLLKYNYIHSSTRVRQLGGYCMGVYIIQQFILWGLYYHTSFPQWVGSLALPWLGFLITLIGSLIIVHLMLKSKIGRFLIG